MVPSALYAVHGVSETVPHSLFFLIVNFFFLDLNEFKLCIEVLSFQGCMVYLGLLNEVSLLQSPLQTPLLNQ